MVTNLDPTMLDSRGFLRWCDLVETYRRMFKELYGFDLGLATGSLPIAALEGGIVEMDEMLDAVDASLSNKSGGEPLPAALSQSEEPDR